MIENGHNLDKVKYFKLADYIQSIKLSESTLEHMEETNQEFDKYMRALADFKEDIVKLLEKFNDFLVNFAKTENAVLNAAETIKVARGHIDGNKGAILPIVQRMIDVYESPLTTDNARLLKRMKYDYTGSKKRAKPTEQLAQETEANISGELFGEIEK